ncbi:hypothetical protein AVEN_105917-1 [Araneus ventricosus]|uniref:Uncharacterized protein n=1 Tax=Araneus ventricosus TaxID=182803 RepID=A0A4Y2TJ54_ARAVE|nr:hypothetical protein AVEN_105917-1 [Araneus ventricosus]
MNAVPIPGSEKLEVLSPSCIEIVQTLGPMSESVVVGCWYTPAGIRLTPPTYDVTCSRPLRLFSEIGFRAWNPQAPKPRHYHLAIAAIKKIRGEFKV